MKRQDIKISEEYCYQQYPGQDSTGGSRVTVLGFETVEYRLRRSWDPKRTKTMIRVKLARSGDERLVDSRNIVRTWAEHAVLIEQEQKAREQREAQRTWLDAREDEVRALFAQRYLTAYVTTTRHCVEITFSGAKEIERFIEFLKSTPVPDGR